MTDMITIEGAHGEGGGQILRASLALALATGRPFRAVNIRAGRAKPGLLRQHLTAVQAARAVSGAEVTGAELRSQALTFVPGPLRPGPYQFAIGSAGSTMLVLQALVPALLVGEGAWSIELEGGTHNPMAPSFEFFERALMPLLARMGGRLTATLDRPGFAPAGGGKVRVEAHGTGRLGRLELVARGAIRDRRVTALVSNLPRSIGERELAAACDRLGWDASCGRIAHPDGAGPGNTLSIAVEAEHVTEVFTGHGAQGRRAEAVALAVADECAAYLATDAPVGEHLADQLLVPMALGGGGVFRTMAPTGHTTTQIDLLRHFLGIEVGCRAVDGVWELEVPARGRAG